MYVCTYSTAYCTYPHVHTEFSRPLAFFNLFTKRLSITIDWPHNSTDCFSSSCPPKLPLSQAAALLLRLPLRKQRKRRRKPCHPSPKWTSSCLLCLSLWPSPSCPVTSSNQATCSISLQRTLLRPSLFQLSLSFILSICRSIKTPFADVYTSSAPRFSFCSHSSSLILHLLLR